MTAAEQDRADAALRDAVAAACAVHGWAKGASLREFVIAGMLIEDEPSAERVRTRYFTLLGGEDGTATMPQHHVLGLLDQAAHYHHT